MPTLTQKVAAELEQIEGTLALLPPLADGLAGRSPLEVAGVAASLHGFCSGVEIILKQCLSATGTAPP